MGQEFLGYILNKNQKVLSMMGPSGTGKSFSADFLQEYLGYRIAKQLTTRDPRSDDKHYTYIGREEFIKLEEAGKILGVFSGDRKELTGNGYGYLVEDVLEQLNDYKKIILFSSAYELEKPNFGEQYGTSDKIGLAFKDVLSVFKRAQQCNKVLSEEELSSRIRIATELIQIMEAYNLTGDRTFNMLYSDDGPVDLNESKAYQIGKILEFIGENPCDFQGDIEDYVNR